MLHACFEHVDDVWMLINEIVVFIGVLDKIVEFDRGFEMEVGFKRDE